MIAYTIRVEGRVQGVGFRYHTAQEARRLELSGTVQNLSDGSVKIWVQGEDLPMRQFLKWCHSGPDTAYVLSLIHI